MVKLTVCGENLMKGKAATRGADRDQVIEYGCSWISNLPIAQFDAAVVVDLYNFSGILL